MQPFYLLLVCPAVALLGTPFLPFVNAPALWFGLPSVVVWVCLWCVLTSGLLAWVLRREHGSGDAPPAENAAPADAGANGGEAR
ncbi:hypothetical protein GCM10027174_32870 [Salinifilum aidingensis]